MKKHHFYPLAALLVVVSAMAVVALPSLAKTSPLHFVFPAKIKDATIGTSYTYVFCNPDPGKSKFCGKVLAKANKTKNPTGGVPPYTFKAGVGLPFGLAMNLNGTIAGKPKSYTPTGKRKFQVCVTDHVGKKKCQNVYITVKKKPKTTKN